MILQVAGPRLGNSLVGLLALFFALGYAVAKVGSRPDPRGVGVVAASAPVPTAAPTAAPAPVAPAPAVVAAPAPAPVPAPAPSVAPAPAPTVAAAPPSAPAPAPPAAPAAPPPDPNQIWRVTVSPEDAQMGKPEAPVTVVLFTSFGCGTCLPFKDAPKKIAAQYGDKVRLVIKHKVIPAQNPDDLGASIAALAAKNQGKFWEFHDRLFESRAIDATSLEGHATALGLDMAKFKADLTSSGLRGQAMKDSLLANEVAAHSMPNVMVNGVRMAGDKSVDNMMALIEKQLAPAEEAFKKASDPKTFYAGLIAGGKSFPQIDPAPPIAISDVDTPILGKKDAPITLTTFEDFECPFCSQIAPSRRMCAPVRSL